MPRAEKPHTLEDMRVVCGRPMQSYLLLDVVLVEKWTNACSCTVSCNCCPGTPGTIDLGLACWCHVPEAPAGLQGRRSRLPDIINEWKIERGKREMDWILVERQLKASPRPLVYSWGFSGPQPYGLHSNASLSRSSSNGMPVEVLG